MQLKTLVGAAGFEPATPCAQGRCATRLRYAPTKSIVDCLTVPPPFQNLIDRTLPVGGGVGTRLQNPARATGVLCTPSARTPAAIRPTTLRRFVPSCLSAPTLHVVAAAADR